MKILVVICFTALLIGCGGEVNVDVGDSQVCCEGDANKDGLVNTDDFPAVQENFGQACINGDADCNGFVNTADFATINEQLTRFGECRCTVNEPFNLPICRPLLSGNIPPGIEASTPTPTPTPEPLAPLCCDGDADKDGVVSIFDYVAVSTNFGAASLGTVCREDECVPFGPGDANCDGAVTNADLDSIEAALMATNWAACHCPGFGPLDIPACP